MALPEDDVEEVEPDDALARILDHEHDALVVGPGLRPGPRDGRARRAASSRSRTTASPPPAVVDAEALRSLAVGDGWWERVRRPCVLTPHAGEFARLRPPAGSRPEPTATSSADDAARERAARDAAAAWGQVVVLKGARTVIAAPDGRVAVAPFENPALATGGTGDVLAGAIGALLAQGLAPYDAARLGVYLHGAAGEVVRERIGDAGLLAVGPAARARARPQAPGRDRRRPGRGRPASGSAPTARRRRRRAS